MFVVVHVFFCSAFCGVTIVASSQLQRSCCHKVGGCSAGGLTVILHLDYIRSLLPHSVPWCQHAVLQPKMVTECWNMLESWQGHMTVLKLVGCIYFYVYIYILNRCFSTVFQWCIHSKVAAVSSFDWHKHPRKHICGPKCTSSCSGASRGVAAMWHVYGPAQLQGPAGVQPTLCVYFQFDGCLGKSTLHSYKSQGCVQIRNTQSIVI